ncbi:IMP dehydrogenase [Candidatus Roizmanbacteria bacterium]|nr:IMP dehydrogenase [Candidatus Roizmanbacteria bacterium]
MKNKIVGQGITFDDVLLLPDYSNFSRNEIDLKTKLTRKISLEIPFVSAPMDTVTESGLAIELARLGGIGIIHRNLTINSQAEEVKKVLNKKLKVGAAVGANEGYKERAEALIKSEVSVLIIDSAHGHAQKIIDAVKYIKRKYPKTQVVAGNIATAKAAEILIKAGADGLRVGMGPGAICTTRIISGMGVPQVTALIETCSVAQKYDVPIIADGGIKYSGDMVKALGFGASTLMMGSFFASAKESPGKLVKIKKGGKSQLYKEYRGMGSIGAMKKGAKIKSEDEFHGKHYKDRVLVSEGVEGLVRVKGTTKQLVEQAIGGIKSGMYYVGLKNIKELHEKAKFLQITQASLTESHPHNLLITNSGENYSH